MRAGRPDSTLSRSRSVSASRGRLADDPKHDWHKSLRAPSPSRPPPTRTRSAAGRGAGRSSSTTRCARPISAAPRPDRAVGEGGVVHGVRQDTQRRWPRADGGEGPAAPARGASLGGRKAAE